MSSFQIVKCVFEVECWVKAGNPVWRRQMDTHGLCLRQQIRCRGDTKDNDRKKTGKGKEEDKT